MNTIDQTDAKTSLLSSLKRYFGFSSFRVFQEEIITEVLGARDVFALLPTGGGKSLCFQLPALVRPGLTVVVSPLIALMKDQVDSLTANGVAATFLNSSLTTDQARVRFRELHEGKFRLLYVAPERLMMPEFLETLKSWNVTLFAIDEAHCISEWGHDFRPEYRRLAELRDHFPTVPLLALTATATSRVQADIVKQLRLKKPACFIASFNRPNLVYRVWPKSKPYDQLLAFLRLRPTESGIVYCQSRMGTEELADRLQEDGVEALPYHAGLETARRTENQELFLRDDARVICATIAFGMGINKSNVRFVVHYDLPKNIEGYYQETGRSGRDGLPAECILLFRAGDVAKQLRFIDEKPNLEEQTIARAQLQQMVHYAETSECRRAVLLRYFGETVEPRSCETCDNCLEPRSTFDGTLAAQKFLSCVYRIKEKSGFGVGLNHVVDVLVGAQNEKVLRWDHDSLSTYGIGEEHKRSEWHAIGRELLRKGFLSQIAGGFGALNLTPEGKKVLIERQSVSLTQPLLSKKRGSEKSFHPGEDDPLFERLRRLRKQLADAQNVPAYVIFSDATLRQMASQRPTTREGLLQISGVGAKKLEAFGQAFIDEISQSALNR
jgi:ATP-dependent DNA helicase RecQ